MIDWLAFITVAAVALVASVLVVGFYALGLRLLGPGEDTTTPSRRGGAIACFAVCGLAVLYGIYLIIPALH
jgi:hypothetical protein